MTYGELQTITTQDWLLSLWPLWLFIFGWVLGIIAKMIKP